MNKLFVSVSVCFGLLAHAQRVFTRHDFAPHFSLTYRAHNDIDADAQALLAQTEVYDAEYHAHKEYYDGLAKKYSAHVARGYIAPVYIKWCGEVKGYGVFAKKKIKKDMLIGEYTGIVRSYLKNPDSRYAFAYPTIRIGDTEYDELVIDAQDDGNVTRFVNHSVLHKNVECATLYDAQGRHIIFYALRDIAPGEELYIDYGADYWEHLGELPEE